MIEKLIHKGSKRGPIWQMDCDVTRFLILKVGETNSDKLIKDLIAGGIIPSELNGTLYLISIQPLGSETVKIAGVPTDKDLQAFMHGVLSVLGDTEVQIETPTVDLGHFVTALISPVQGSC